MKKTDKYEHEGYILLCIIVLILLIETIGNYCNTHAEEIRQKDWQRFEDKVQQIHYMKWENE